MMEESIQGDYKYRRLLLSVLYLVLIRFCPLKYSHPTLVTRRITKKDTTKKQVSFGGGMAMKRWRFGERNQTLKNNKNN